MAQPTYDELLHYTHALDKTLAGLLDAIAHDRSLGYSVQISQTVDKSMTLTIRTTIPVDYEEHLSKTIQRLHTHIPGVKNV